MLKFGILLISLLVSTVYSVNMPVKPKTFLYRYPNVRDLVDLGVSIVFWPVGIATHIHELSHALAEKTFDKSSTINIHIGGLPGINSNPLLKTKGFTIESFDILKGAYVQTLGSTTTTKAQEIMFLAAGPLGGILSSLLCKKIIDRIEDPCIKESYKCCINIILAHQALYGFTPFLDPRDGIGDGYRIWEKLCLPANRFTKFTKHANIAFLVWAMIYTLRTIQKNWSISKNKDLVSLIGMTVFVKVLSMIRSKTS